jgi:hypothetical protein
LHEKYSVDLPDTSQIEWHKTHLSWTFSLFLKRKQNKEEEGEDEDEEEK